MRTGEWYALKSSRSTSFRSFGATAGKPWRSKKRRLSAEALAKEDEMFYAYKLRSLSDPKRRYIGSISDLRARLAKHNAGAVPHTSKYLPWKVENYSAFETREKAIAFEMYLKSGSGRAFASKHFQTEGSACTRFMSNGYLERERFDTSACRS